MKNNHRFNDAERSAIYRTIAERRDMRHFLPNPVDSCLLKRLLIAANQASNVGLMQPWRFIRITDRNLRNAIASMVEEERQRTASALQKRGDEFMRLKVEGIRECGELLVAALSDRREQHIFVRRTLPEMDLVSVSCAIQNLWLAVRAEGLGMGWVSLFDPIQLAQLLNMPDGSKPIAILCLGHVEDFYPAPMLKLEGWAEERPLHELLFHNYWNNVEIKE